MKKFWQDFKKFITRGNVIDMAVGVAVATAFTAIVTAFTKGFISPLIALLTGESSLETMTHVLRPAKIDPETEEIIEPAVELLWGAFLQKIIDFLIIALVLFVALRIVSAVMAHSRKIRQNVINALTDADEKAAAEAEEKAKAEAEEKARAEAEAAVAAEKEAARLEAESAKIREEEERRKCEVALLTEIRDLLKNK